MTRLEKLRARLAEIQEELRSLAEVDADELTEEQDARFTELEGILSDAHEDGAERGLLDEIEREEKRAKLLERANSAVERGGRPGETGDDRGTPNINTRTDPFDLSGVAPYGPERRSEVTARTLSAIEESERFVEDAHREQATALVQRYGRGQEHFSEYVLLGAREAYADAFLRKMTGEDLSPEERAALAQRKMLARAMSLSDVTGVLVPTHLDTQLIIATDGAVNPFRRVCRVETGVTNVYQSVRTGGVTSDWTPEAEEVGDNSPTFANPTATAYKNTIFVPISFEAFEDARGRESDIIQLMNERKDEDEATVLAVGNGTDRPRGLITALAANTNSHVANITSNTYSLDDVYRVYEAVPPRYRNDRTAWFMNLAFLNDTRQFGDESFHSQTVQLGARTIPAILGHPAFEASAMASAITTAATNNIAAVGDPQTYLIYDRLGMSVEFVPNLFHGSNMRPSGQRGWLAHYRQGANLTVGHAAADTVVGFRLLQTATN